MQYHKMAHCAERTNYSTAGLATSACLKLIAFLEASEPTYLYLELLLNT